MGPVNYGNGGITFNPADSAGGIINYSSIIAQETTRMDVGRIVALTAVSMIPVGRVGDAIIGGERSVVAAGGGVLADANYAQRTFSQSFSSGGTFAGQTVGDMAAALRSGVINPANVPIQYIVQDGNTLMLNTRSAQALEQAGIPRVLWNAVDMTGDAAAQARLAAQLQRNGLTSQGISTVTPGH